MLVSFKGNSPKLYRDSGNQVYLGNDGIIYKAFRGDQNAETIKKISQKTIKLVNWLKEHKKPALILVDLSDLGKTTLSARNQEIELIKTLNFDKAAVFGQDFYTRHLAEVIVRFSGMEYKIKFFDSEQEAREWLLNS